jgi:hypothetical protein
MSIEIIAGTAKTSQAIGLILDGIASFGTATHKLTSVAICQSPKKHLIPLLESKNRAGSLNE